uniref:Repressor of RNA polymerase III transcription n=1 Tax=Chromera velia CCMP2878 TaxID=1169474 RepID=A0A0G4HFY6_9ALVE|eukprot:Cvel_27206.t1-p1 / transcript=Cvel_27206.t1 / gene=Cvel_27206 / organism=Chromera_velia_CCMP2878 / gene_product=Repressor of RNA polymerase III transcription MAF1, putative / transcript_product=Repressor of RNA polymerase III transcription MAF1, putative / location=Cvel_scaffold3360:3776-5835(-) / protein_length=223 / sequence_SO=supercontig / SO=protein_coding / is_pseudo=false
MLVTLISTMNQIFPDYDFSSIHAEQFELEKDLQSVFNAISCNFSRHVDRLRPGFTQELWAAIGHCLNLADVEVYSYTHELWDEEGAPMGGECAAGVLWAFDYFFVDRRRRRVLFLNCAVTSNWGGDEVDCDDFDEDTCDHPSSSLFRGRSSHQQDFSFQGSSFQQQGGLPSSSGFRSGGLVAGVPWGLGAGMSIREEDENWEGEGGDMDMDMGGAGEDSFCYA